MIEPCTTEDPIAHDQVFDSMGGEFTSSFFVGDFHITTKDVGSCEGGETSFLSEPKEYYKSDLHVTS